MVEDYKAYYDTIASVFDRLRLDRGAKIETTLRLIAQFVNSEDGYILDIGCRDRSLRRAIRKGWV